MAMTMFSSIRLRLGPFRGILSNISSMAIVQGMALIIPLMTLPYLLRTLGPSAYGKYAYAYAVLMCFDIFVRFGFDLSATKMIAECRGCAGRVSQVFWSTLLAKKILLILAFVLLFTLAKVTGMSPKDSQLYMLGFLVVVGSSLLPTWLYLGLEEMKYLAMLNFNLQLIYLALMFMLVKAESDYVYVAFSYGVSSVLVGIFGLTFAIKRFKLGSPKNVGVDIVEAWRNSYHYFLSRVANDGARHLSIMVVGAGFGPVVLGVYSAIERMFFAFVSVGGIVSQAIYPRMAAAKDLRLFVNVFFVVMLFVASALLVLVFFRRYLFEILGFSGFDLDLASEVFVVIFSASLFHVASGLIGYPLLGVFGYSREANNTLIFSAFFSMLFISVASLFLKSISVASWSIFVYSALGFLMRSIYLWRFGVFRGRVENGY